MEYKTEGLKFYNMKKTDKHRANAKFTNDMFKIFEIEDQLTEQEKVEFIDNLKDGVATYLINIITKWESEKDTLPKDRWGNPKTVSKKAWIKRHDERKIINIEYKIGRYHLFGTEFKTMCLICPTTEYSYNMAYTDKNIVHQWFHDLCYLLFREEQKYFKEHDEFQIKLSKLVALGNQYSIVFDSKELNDIVWNRKNDIDEKTIDKYINAYEKLEQLIDQISDELKQQTN
jgi:hypothetical protein